MGTNNLVTKSNGEIVNVTDPNQYKEALVGDIVPRALSGVATANAGDLGQGSLPFGSVYVTGSVVNTGVVTTMVYTSTDTWEAPTGVMSAKVTVCGGGGAGSAATYSTGGGGGGVASATVEVAPGSTYDITISSGSADFHSLLSGSVGEASGVKNAGALGGTFSISSTLIGYGCHGGTGGAGFELPSGGDPIGGNGGTGYSGRGGLGGRDAATDALGGGGGGYANGSSAAGGNSGAGGGYTAASGTTGGSAGVIIQYYLPTGVVDPN